MKKNIILFSFAVFAVLVALPLSAGASTGLSINTGQIILQKSLVSGGTYDLPNIEVKNTGSEPSDYEITVQYNEVQSQMKPKASWFHFEPAKFNLLPGELKIVKTKINVSSNASAGDYFAYIEAHSINDKVEGNSISGAAASKLYFSVSHFNIFKTIYYNLLSLVKKYSPWSYGLLVIISIIILFFFLKRLYLIIKNNSVREH